MFIAIVCAGTASLTRNSFQLCDTPAIIRVRYLVARKSLSLLRVGITSCTHALHTLQPYPRSKSLTLHA